MIKCPKCGGTKFLDETVACVVSLPVVFDGEITTHSTLKESYTIYEGEEVEILADRNDWNEHIWECIGCKELYKVSELFDQAQGQAPA